MPTDYAATLEDLKKHVLAARLEAQRKINNELLQLCWRIGRTILGRQAEEDWGTNVQERLPQICVQRVHHEERAFPTGICSTCGLSLRTGPTKPILCNDPSHKCRGGM